MQFPTAGKDAQAYGRRGSTQSNRGCVYRIEGEYVTMAEIAERIGKSPKMAGLKMGELRKASGPITWDRLRK